MSETQDGELPMNSSNAEDLDALFIVPSSMSSTDEEHEVKNDKDDEAANNEDDDDIDESDALNVISGNQRVKEKIVDVSIEEMLGALFSSNELPDTDVVEQHRLAFNIRAFNFDPETGEFPIPPATGKQFDNNRYQETVKTLK
jgi:hypothetical protein